MIRTLEFTKGIINVGKLDSEIKAITSKYEGLTIKDDSLILVFSVDLNQDEIDLIYAKVNTFVEVSLVEETEKFLNKTVDPFFQTFLIKLRAENITMGITQAEKTYDVASLFEQKYVLFGKPRGISFLGCIQSGSVTLLIPLIDFLLANPSEWTGLEPFVTEQRLNDWKTEVIEFLN
jgi:hypothetical protein